MIHFWIILAVTILQLVLFRGHNPETEEKQR